MTAFYGPVQFDIYGRRRVPTRDTNSDKHLSATSEFQSVYPDVQGRNNDRIFIALYIAENMKIFGFLLLTVLDNLRLALPAHIEVIPPDFNRICKYLS